MTIRFNYNKLNIDADDRKRQTQETAGFLLEAGAGQYHDHPCGHDIFVLFIWAGFGMGGELRIKYKTSAQLEDLTKRLGAG